MCTVEYGACPDGVDCSGTTPVTGNIHLDLPRMCMNCLSQYVLTCALAVGCERSLVH